MALTKVTYPDSEKILLGTGNDLEIYHDGSHSYIKDGGTGKLRILSSEVLIANPADSENIAKFIEDGAVELYYDNSKKFETTSSGVDCSDQLQVDGTTFATGGLKVNSDSNKLRLGAGDDLELYHNGTNSYIENNTGQLQIKVDEFRLLNNAGSENMIDASADGAVKLYYDSSKKLETATDGIEISNAANSKVEQKFHYGSNSGYGLITLDSGNNFIFEADVGSASSDSYISFKVDGTEKIRIKSDGRVSIPDNSKFIVGTNDDLEMWHDGSNSRIHDTGTGVLAISGSDVHIQNNNQTQSIAKFLGGSTNSSAELYYNDVKTFETTSNGVKVLGPEGGSAELLLYADEGDDAADKFRILIDNSAPDFYIQNYNNGSSWENSLRLVADGGAHLYHNNSLKLETIASGVKTQGSGEVGLYCGSTNAGGAYLFLDGDSNGDFSGSDYAYIGHNTTGDLEVAARRPSGGNAAVTLKAYDGSANSLGNAFIAAHDAVWSYHAFYPWTDDNRDLGYSGRRWDDIHATNPTIQTSDRNEKDNITNTDLGLSFINKLTPKSYKFKGKTRTHYGLIAQDIEDVLSDIGKSTTQFAGFIKTDIPVEHYTQYDESIPEGKSIGDVKKEAFTRYGLRYGEFLGPLIKAVQELSIEVETLKTKVSALEAK